MSVSTAQKVAVMQAFLNGREIEYRRAQWQRLDGADEAWQTNEDPVWDWRVFEYRIKSEGVAARRYVRETCNFPGGPTMRTIHLLNDNAAKPSDVERMSGFVRWIDTDWVYPDEA